jgi:glycosyltransferase involved in cell wall biosynthesis
MDRRVARDILGIPHDRKILLFGAIGASSDPRKGAALLREALAGLTGSDCECVVIGNTRPELGFDASVKVRGLGVIRDRYSMVLAYNAADVVVVPSLQENLSNVIMESLSCGTPVVGFRVGGNIDMIEDGWNGAIAERISGESLRDAINRTLHAPNLGQFGVNARTRVVSDYSLAVIGKKYEQLYKSIQ